MQLECVFPYFAFMSCLLLPSEVILLIFFMGKLTMFLTIFTKVSQVLVDQKEQFVKHRNLSCSAHFNKSLGRDGSDNEACITGLKVTQISFSFLFKIHCSIMRKIFPIKTFCACQEPESALRIHKQKAEM